MWTVRVQISVRFRARWSAPSLSACIIINYYIILMDTEVSNQTSQMPSNMWYGPFSHKKAQLLFRPGTYGIRNSSAIWWLYSIKHTHRRMKQEMYTNIYSLILNHICETEKKVGLDIAFPGYLHFYFIGNDRNCSPIYFLRTKCLFGNRRDSNLVILLILKLVRISTYII